MIQQAMESAFGMVGFVGALFPVSYGAVWLTDKVSSFIGAPTHVVYEFDKDEIA